VRLDVIDQRLVELREGKEVRGLGHPLDRSARRCEAVDDLVLCVEGLVAYRVPALVRAEVDVA